MASYYTPDFSFENVFTREQIAAIESIIDERLGLEIERPVVAKVDYHTIPEIRQLIQDNLSYLVPLLGPNDFDIAVLRHFLARKTELREGDYEVTGSESMTRWEKQVLKAVSNDYWMNAPIVRTKYRTYKVSEDAYAKFSA